MSAVALARRVLDSPTLTSWSSFGVRALTLPILLPVFLTRLDPQQLKVWFLINAVLSLTALSDIGFSHTFYRLIQGVDRIAVSKRWDTLIQAGSVSTMLLTLLLGGAKLCVIRPTARPKRR